jgi:hypothetical protein
MAVREAEVWGRKSLLIDRLLTPRPITRIALWAIGILLAQAAWHYLPVKLLSYVSGIAAPFCLLIASTVWSMRDKVDAAFDGEHLDSASFQKARRTAQFMRRRSMFRAALVAIAALAAGSPLISNQVAGPIWHWMVILAGLGVGESTYSYLLADAWEEQARAMKDHKILQSKQRDEQEALIARIEASVTARSSTSSNHTAPEVAGSLFKPH